MSDLPEIILNADMSNVEETCKDAEQKLDVIEENRQKTEQATSSSMRHIARGMIGVVGITTSIVEGMGIALDPVGQALLGMITSTISALQSMSIALAAGGITAVFAVATTAAAIYLSVHTLEQATKGVDQSKSELRAAQNALRLLHSSITLARAGGW